jgi:hypothetical protein
MAIYSTHTGAFMNTAHQTTSTFGLGACNSMAGDGHEFRQGRDSGLVFSGLVIGTRFLDLAFGSWWVKTGENSGSCNEYEDSGFAMREVAGFRPDEAVALSEPVYQSLYQN